MTGFYNLIVLGFEADVDAAATRASDQVSAVIWVFLAVE